MSHLNVTFGVAFASWKKKIINQIILWLVVVDEQETRTTFSIYKILMLILISQSAPLWTVEIW